MNLRKDFAISFAALAVVTLAHAGCATFQKAQADVPGTVSAGLSMTACVTAAMRDQPDALSRENAIYACVASALGTLSESDKRTLLALPPGK